MKGRELEVRVENTSGDQSDDQWEDVRKKILGWGSVIWGGDRAEVGLVLDWCWTDSR